MHLHILDPEHASDKSIRCGHCWDADATHIELNHTGEHHPDEHLVLCKPCAYLAGLLTCPGCDTGRKVIVMAHHLFGELIPAYAPTGLDGDGHCGWHLGLPLQTPKPREVTVISAERTG